MRPEPRRDIRHSRSWGDFHADLFCACCSRNKKFWWKLSYSASHRTTFSCSLSANLGCLVVLEYLLFIEFAQENRSMVFYQFFCVGLCVLIQGACGCFFMKEWKLAELALSKKKFPCHIFAPTLVFSLKNDFSMPRTHPNPNFLFHLDWNPNELTQKHKKKV